MVTHYTYVCLNRHNQHLVGDLEALDKYDLSRRLAEHKLHLVWWQAADVKEFVDPVDASPFNLPTPISEETAQKIIWRQRSVAPEKSVQEKPLQEKPAARSFRLSLWFLMNRTVGVIIGIVIGLYAGFLWIRLPSRVPTELAGIASTMKKLHPGMTRGELEMILTQRAASTTLPSVTRYQEQGYVIEVIYQPTGGFESPDNRVRFYELRNFPRPPAPVQ